MPPLMFYQSTGIVTPVGLTKSIPPFPRTYFEKQSAPLVTPVGFKPTTFRTGI